MVRTTNREYLAWSEWLDKQWNEPDRADHYSMRIAENVLIAAGYKNPGDQKVKFEKKAVKPKTTMTREEAAEYSRTQWSMIVPFNRKKDE